MEGTMTPHELHSTECDDTYPHSTLSQHVYVTNIKRNHFKKIRAWVTQNNTWK